MRERNHARSPVNLKQMPVKALLQLQGSAIEELKRRKIVRTRNNPVGDYTEWLISTGLGLTLSEKSTAGHDAKDQKGKRIEIKGRRITPQNKSRQLSAIRNLNDKQFDYLGAVVFDEDYEILDAVMIPHEVVCEYASFRKHVNAHILHLRGEIVKDKRVRDISTDLSQVNSITRTPN